MIFVSNQECNLFKKSFMNQNVEDHFFFQGGENWSYLFFSDVNVVVCGINDGSIPNVYVHMSSVTARILKRRAIFVWQGDFKDYHDYQKSFMYMLPIGLKDDMFELLSIKINKRLYKGHYEHFYVTQN